MPSDSPTKPEAAPAARPTRRVTQLDIARAAGVHNATVSLALRNSPSISDETRQRIRTLAAELGYHPDPALRALAAYRRGLAHRTTETIAYITAGDTRWGWRESRIEEQNYLGAVRKAEECGYHLEHFWLGEPGMNPKRLGAVLYHRGITGLLLAGAYPDSDGPLDFDWSQFSVVRIGRRAHTPALHRVTSDALGAMRLAVRRVVAAGYRRPGLILSQAGDDAADRAFSLGFFTEQNRLSLERPIPIFFDRNSLPCNRSATADAAVKAAELDRWLDEFQPDVILGSFAHGSRLSSTFDFVVPSRLAFADPFDADPDVGLAGIRQNQERVGELAVEILAGQLQQNVCGAPAVPTTTLVESVWCDGASLPCASGTWEQKSELPATESEKEPEQTAA